MRSPRQIFRANLFMWAIVALVAMGGACKKRAASIPAQTEWYGIPATRACNWDQLRRAVCIAEGKEYTCIQDDNADRIVCVEKNRPLTDVQ